MEKRRKRREDFALVVWSIGVALLIQVFYDALGEYPNPNYIYSLKFWGGMVAGILLSVFAMYIYREKDKPAPKATSE